MDDNVLKNRPESFYTLQHDAECPFFKADDEILRLAAEKLKEQKRAKVQEQDGIVLLMVL